MQITWIQENYKIRQKKAYKFNRFAPKWDDLMGLVLGCCKNGTQEKNRPTR